MKNKCGCHCFIDGKKLLSLLREILFKEVIVAQKEVAF